MKIFFATKNKSKWDYFMKWCANLDDLEVLTPFDIDQNLWPEIDENGATLIENAEIKAITWSKIIPGIVVLANDCGVAIPGLGNNWKQEWTKRTTGDENASDMDRIKVFLSLTKDLQGEKRRIQWTDAIALAINGSLLGSKAGKYPIGQIIESVSANPSIIPGAPLATVEYVFKYGKVYSELSEKEIHDHGAEVEMSFANYIGDTLAKL